MTIRIVHHLTGSVLWEGEAESVEAALRKAMAENIDVWDANPRDTISPRAAGVSLLISLF